MIIKPNNNTLSSITALPSGMVSAPGLTTGSLVLIYSQTASDASNIIFDNDASGVVFDDAYKCYMFNFQRIYGATNDVKIHMITRSGASDSGGTFRQQAMYHTYNGSTSTNPASAPNNDKLLSNSWNY